MNHEISTIKGFRVKERVMAASLLSFQVLAYSRIYETAYSSGSRDATAHAHKTYMHMIYQSS